MNELKSWGKNSLIKNKENMRNKTKSIRFFRTTSVIDRNFKGLLNCTGMSVERRAKCGGTNGRFMICCIAVWDGCRLVYREWSSSDASEENSLENRQTCHQIQAKCGIRGLYLITPSMPQQFNILAMRIDRLITRGNIYVFFVNLCKAQFKTSAKMYILCALNLWRVWMDCWMCFSWHGTGFDCPKNHLLRFSILAKPVTIRSS